MLKRNPTCNGCEKCGAKLNGQRACCCTHTCDAICVKLQPESECPPQDTCECDEPQSVYVLYDPITESYHGTISCGTASVDFDIKLKHDKDLGCLMCLTSSCLDFYGDNCQEAFDGTPSCIGTKDVQNGDLVGGMEFSWPITMENCGDPYCVTTFELSAKCVDRISPEEITETYVDSGCTGCECLCKELCITWMYDDGIDTCTKQARSNFDHNSNSWEFAFKATAGQPAACTLKISIFLQKNEYTGACEMVVITYVDDSYSETETIIPLEYCPFVNIDSLELNEFETITIVCHECDGCFPEKCACDCYELPDSLTVSWSYTQFFGIPCDFGPPVVTSRCATGSFTITRTQLQNEFEPTNVVSIGECSYHALNKFCGGENLLILYGFESNNPLLAFSCDLDEGHLHVHRLKRISVSCDPLELVFESDPSNGSTRCMTNCPELGPGDGVRITITE